MLIANETPPTGLPVCFLALVERVREMSKKCAVLRKMLHSSRDMITENQICKNTVLKCLKYIFIYYIIC